MHTRGHVISIAALGLGLLASGIAAQERPERDSLEQRVHTLQAQLDSLQRVVARLIAEGRDTTEVVDELAALRAAARAVVPEQPRDTAPTHFVMRSRDLNRLNPEISVTGDVRFRANRPGPQRDNVDIREFSFSFQSALDPYTHTKVFTSFGKHGAEIEEAYVYWTSLPGGVRVDVGRFRQQAGELNRWHLHALPESEYPLVVHEYFGDDGLRGDGLSLYWAPPITTLGGAAHEVHAQLTMGTNDALFQDGRRISILGHLNNFWQVSRSSFVQIGLTGVYGENPDSSLKTAVAGANLRFTWRPPDRSIYNSFTLRAEGFAVRQRFAGVGETRYGGYVGADWQLSRQWYVGGRFDYVEPLGSSLDATWAAVPHITWWQSEWIFLRAEWQHCSVPTIAGVREASDRLVLQVVWSIGPHKHETY